MAKLEDIAREVGVSSKTVSMSLRGMKCASDKTTRTIRAVADRLGYVPNQAARVMRLQQSQFIGVMADNVATTPHTVELIRGAQREAMAHDRHLLIGTLDGNPAAEREFLSMFQAHQVAGVIYTTLYRREIADGPHRTALRTVLANCTSREPAAASVLPDDFGGGFLQGQHLARLGHRRIAVISLSHHAPAMAPRMDGVAAALREAGIVLDEGQVREGVQGPAESETYVAFEAALDLLDRADRPSAIICGNDRIAMLVYCAASRLGLRIPEDLSLIGFDDFVTVSEGLRPELTTIEIPYFEMGSRAVRAVLDPEAAGTGSDPVPCRLVERQSCAPCQQG